MGSMTPHGGVGRGNVLTVFLKLTQQFELVVVFSFPQSLLILLQQFHIHKCTNQTAVQHCQYAESTNDSSRQGHAVLRQRGDEQTISASAIIASRSMMAALSG